MFAPDSATPEAIAETAQRAREQIKVMSAAETLEQADDLYGELLGDLCVSRGRGLLDLDMHNQLAAETVRAMMRWKLPSKVA